MLVELVQAGGALVLSGAGLSTESGIPDYRGPDGTRRVTPMTYAEFVGAAEGRRRYWARAYAGWRRFAAAEPNEGHRVVAALQRRGLVPGVITQNVDRLHQRAGSPAVLELHGSLDRVVCLGCGSATPREAVHRLLRQANPDFPSAAGQVRPDGDVVVADDVVRGFTGPSCPACGSDLMKPDVVYFGESVPKERVDRAFAMVEAAQSLVVLGSSLKVMSGYRFVRRMATLRRPVAIVTRGWSRGDAEATVRVDAALGVTLTALLRDLGVAADGTRGV